MPESVVILESKNGMKVGEVAVLFKSEQEAKWAFVEKDHKYIGSRYAELFIFSYKTYTQVRERKSPYFKRPKSDSPRNTEDCAQRQVKISNVPSKTNKT